MITKNQKLPVFTLYYHVEGRKDSGRMKFHNDHSSLKEGPYATYSKECLLKDFYV